MNDQHFMDMALDLAEKGRGYTSPNPMVGAVLVKDFKVVGKGYHRKAGQAHAEVNAIDDAGDSADGATLYVTLEPCNHIGRTPPCTEKIIQAGIRRVVVAMEDPNPRVEGGGNAYLKSRGLTVETGLCEERARRLNECFIKYIQTGRPFTILKCAATLDGMIATRTGDSKWVTGEAARAYVHTLRHAVDAILVGIGTVRQDDPSLTTRLEGLKGRDPVRVILDPRATIPDQARVLRLDSDADTLIICGDAVPGSRRNELERVGAVVISSPLKNGRIDLDWLMGRLGEMEISSLLIEGGGKILASAVQERIGDKIALFYAPKILGGSDGVPICSGTGPQRMANALPVEDVSLRRLGEDILIEGYLRN